MLATGYLAYKPGAAYVRRIYARIVVPHKEMLAFDLGRHLIFNECVEEVLPREAAELEAYA